MATNSELRKQIDQLIASLERAGVNTDSFKRKLAEAGQEEEKLVALMDSLVASLDNAEDSAAGLYQTLKSISGELGTNQTALNKTKSIYRKIVDDSRKLRDDEIGITDLNKRQLQSLKQKLSSNKQYLKDQQAGLAVELGRARAANNQERVEELETAMKMAADEGGHIQRNINAVDKRLKLEKEISKNMGVTGALVSGTGALMERLGMRSGIFHDAMEDAAKEMRHQSKILGKNANLLDRAKIAAEGFSIVLKGFGAALRDPATIITGIITAFLDVNKAAVDFTRFTGQSYTLLNGTKTEVAALTDMLKLSAELTKEMGLNAAAIFSPQQTAELADMQLLLGLSVEQTGQLGTLMNLTGKSAKELRSEIYANVDAGISQEVVSQDILSASKDILAATGGNTKELGKAANAARKLGMTLSQVDKIADGLLDFESSISSELEAQLLTGKNINLAKARELALNNDLAGLAEELASNGASAAEFANMNRAQQKALAEALGMSRQELGEMVLAQANLGTLTDAQKAKVRGVSEEQSRQMDIQQRIQQSIAKLAQAFAPLLESIVPAVEALSYVLTPIVSVIGKVSNLLEGWGGYLVGAVLAASMLVKTFQAVKALSIFNLRTALLGEASQKRLLLAKELELGLGGQILAVLGFQNLAIEYKLLREKNSVGMSMLKLFYENTILGAILAQTVGIISQIGKLTIELGIRMGIASAALLANSAVTFGVGAAVAVAAALAAYGMYRAVTADDMVSSPGYGDRTLFGPEGAIQLNNKDTVIAGTNLFGGEGGGGTTNTRALEAKLDMLIATVRAGGNVYLDGNKVGSAQVLGTYKSS